MDNLKKKYLISLLALFIIVGQWMAMVVIIDSNLGLPSFWYMSLWLTGGAAIVTLAYYIGKDGEKAYKKKK